MILTSSRRIVITEIAPKGEGVETEDSQIAYSYYFVGFVVNDLAKVIVKTIRQVSYGFLEE